jgi:hypothetical protein
VALQLIGAHSGIKAELPSGYTASKQRVQWVQNRWVRITRP